MLRIDFVAVLALGLVPKNSLRELRSLRSNSFGKSETVALLPSAGTLKPQRCAPHRPGNRPRH